jgi:hypothetical protein
MKHARHNSQSGAVLLEFALSFMIFWTVMIAVIEFSRYMFSWGTASEATRLAARLASICDQGPVQESRIRKRVEGLILASGQIELGTRTDWLLLNYYPAGCDSGSCIFVEARLSGLQPNLMVPGLGSALNLPTFRVRAPREALRNVIKDETNEVCN